MNNTAFLTTDSTEHSSNNHRITEKYIQKKEQNRWVGYRKKIDREFHSWVKKENLHKNRKKKK